VRAVILAAGVSSRLGSHSVSIPKGLLPLGDSTCLDRTLSILRQVGINDIAITIGYRADVMRRHFAGGAVTLIENPEYATSNSMFSLWCARDFVCGDTDGFVVVNSDLIFKVEMLQALLDAPFPDAMIVDTSTVDFSNDMVKIELRGDQIVHMSKLLEAPRASAEAVGPVKFSNAGGQRFFADVGPEIHNGRRNEWFFYSIGDYAQTHPFHAVPNPGCEWEEFDTSEDLDRVLQKIQTGIL
jgi:choline kinase